MSSNEYGFIPQAPAQSFRNNDGVFSVNDVKNLIDDNKWTTYGQLEHIQTQTASSALVDFTSLGDYNILFATFFDIEVSTLTEFGYRLSDDGGSSWATSYYFANQRGKADGTFTERRSTSQGTARLCGDITTDSTSRASGYIYFYNLLDNTRYSFSTSHTVFVEGTTTCFEFGSQFYSSANSVNGIRFGQGTSMSAITTGTISLYGLKEYS